MTKFNNLEKYQEFVNPANGASFDDGHLGGCNIYGDPAHELPKMTKYLIDTFGIKSILDVGCGFGFHSKFFKDVFGCEIYGVEGSAKVAELSIIPDEIVCHDYTTGAFIPDKQYDLCWSIEFVEHVRDEYKHNFLQTFANCDHLVMTHAIPGQGGHHHVNERNASFWINALKEYGFEFLDDVTNHCRKLAEEDMNDMTTWLLDTNPDKPFRGPSAENYDTDEFRNKYHICYFVNNGLVFRKSQS